MTTDLPLPDLAFLLSRLAEDALTPVEFRQLEQLLENDASARTEYRRHVAAHAMLYWRWHNRDKGQTQSAADIHGNLVDNVDTELLAPHDLTQAWPADIASLSPHSLLSVSDSQGALGYLSSGWPIAYLVATVVFAIGLLVGAFVHVSQPSHVVRDIVPQPAVSPANPAVVAHITATADCVWEGTELRGQGSGAANQKSEIRNHKSAIHLGDRLALRSGLLEITYDTGAKVILQGPVTYEVESPAGGYLSVGKLTARLEKNSEVRDQRSESVNQKSEIRNQNSPDLCPRTSDLFAIRTPTAIVTDLGTEFGVEVNRHGDTTSHVFRGSVKVQLTSRDGPVEGAPRVLHENESVRVSADRQEKPTFVSALPDTRTFVRRLPTRVPIQLFNTGVGLKEGRPDPHWQLIAVSNDPQFKPRPALVTKSVAGCWMSNESNKSQWISAVADASPLPNNLTYTFRTRFDLANVRPETARLRGWFAVDNHVRAIRVNGRSVPVFKHGYDQFDFVHRFGIDTGFINGMNALEIDVDNGPESVSSLARVARATSNATLFCDTFETTPSASARNYPDNSGDYDPTGGSAGSWTITESNHNAVQVTTSNMLPDPVAYEGEKCLRLRRAVYGTDLASATATLAAQSAVGEHLCITQMVYIPAAEQETEAILEITVGNAINLIANGNGGSSVVSYTNDRVSHDTGIDFVAGTWQKWQIDYNVGANTCTLRIGDQRVTGIRVNVVNCVNDATFGAHFNAGNPIYIDDVLVQTSGGPMGLRVELEGTALEK